MDGLLSVLAAVEGYAHWNGENIYVGDAEIELMFTFSFYVNDGKFSEFELANV